MVRVALSASSSEVRTTGEVCSTGMPGSKMPTGMRAASSEMAPTGHCAALGVSRQSSNRKRQGSSAGDVECRTEAKRGR